MNGDAVAEQSGSDQTELQRSPFENAIGQRNIISSCFSFMNDSETKGTFSSAHLLRVGLCRRE